MPFEPGVEVTITLTMAELTQVVVPTLAEQPYRVVAGIMQKIGGQLQSQQMNNGLDRAAPSGDTATAQGSQ